MSVSTFSCLIIPEKNTRENELHKKNIFSEPVAKIITMVSSDRLQHKVQAWRMLFIIYFSLLNIIKIIDQYFRVAQIGCIHYSNWPLVYSLNCHYYQLTKNNEPLTFDNGHQYQTLGTVSRLRLRCVSEEDHVTTDRVQYSGVGPAVEAPPLPPPDNTRTCQVTTSDILKFQSLCHQYSPCPHSTCP